MAGPQVDDADYLLFIRWGYKDDWEIHDYFGKRDSAEQAYEKMQQEIVKPERDGAIAACMLVLMLKET